MSYYEWAHSLADLSADSRWRTQPLENSSLPPELLSFNSFVVATTVTVVALLLHAMAAYAL